jgi:hypothetical protein
MINYQQIKERDIAERSIGIFEGDEILCGETP